METNREIKKTCSIALMSGKGGSGKTTLALSMSSLLSSCGVKTLLVDCDISTNGATYFFEEEMAYYENKIDTLHELIESQKDFEDIQLYPVNEYFDFMPSVTKIGEGWTILTLNQEKELYLKRLFGFISEKYEVVIYDCQAGYTQILETVIRMTDRNLMVLEADSISASAVRNLFLKLNRVWENKRIYQVFNKATKEEAEIYSKVTSGTMFDNIGCILFDWTVRRAFSISKIPDMIHTSADYGMQVCKLCEALIQNPEISQKLSLYIQTKKLEELRTIEKNLNKKVEIVKKEIEIKDSTSNKKQNNVNIFISSKIAYYFFPISASVIIIITLYLSRYYSLNDNIDSLHGAIFIGTLVLLLVGLYDIIRFFVSLSEEKYEMRKTTYKESELEDLYDSLAKVQADIANLEASVNSTNKSEEKMSV